MNLNNIIHSDFPFNHWQFNNCLDENALKEISYSTIPSGERSYDGTRAADHTGKGLDGKLRLFITKENNSDFPYLTKLINSLQHNKLVNQISKLINKDLSKSYVRLEIIGDKKGFWLKPHKDISEKLMTMMIWANPYNESSNLGTDLYDKNFKLVKTIEYIHNSGYLFSSGEDTWHGLELKEIKKERRCIQINYVSFKTDWPVENNS
ncbi:MAG: hypothetical protein CBD97_03525 [Pelagibacteraceae bacterium TMED237]|nr:MAG: hypothetical protein CBD97_03525 [Pelagibacteraceae bacterium TMED237]|tara:strand:- start:1395 stop:2015 length:621 start_codon:yes stop_codon:yes gene_type:complete